MLNSVETTSISTIVSVSPIPSPLDEQKTTLLPFPADIDTYVLLCVGENVVASVSPTLMDGYLAARRAYQEMEKTEYGPYCFLTGYEYAHLTRQYIPDNLSPLGKREWQRGFIAGWNASTFGF